MRVGLRVFSVSFKDVEARLLTNELIWFGFIVLVGSKIKGKSLALIIDKVDGAFLDFLDLEFQEIIL